MDMNLGNGIKPVKGNLWAQALSPALLPGERIHALVKGTAGGVMEDLIAITDLRVLSAQTVNHCRIKTETNLADVAVVERTLGLRRAAVQMSLRSGRTRRVVPSQVMGAGDVDLVHRTLHGLLVAGTPAHLQEAFATRQQDNLAARERRASAEAGIWSNSIVVGSRPRKAAAVSILAHANAGEEPWLIIGSLGAGVLAAFADRLVLIKTGVVTSAMAGSFGTERATTFNFHEITGIEYKSNVGKGVLEILTASYSGTANRDFWHGMLQGLNADTGNPHALSNTLPLAKAEHAHALPHLNALRQRITQFRRTVLVESLPSSLQPSHPAPPHAPTNGGSLADEIAKIAALRDSGVLAEGEFQTAKARLLTQ